MLCRSFGGSCDLAQWLARSLSAPPLARWRQLTLDRRRPSIYYNCRRTAFGRAQLPPARSPATGGSGRQGGSARPARLGHGARAAPTSQSAPSQPAAPAPGTGTGRPARPCRARWRVLQLGEYYNEPPRARKIVFHCGNCRSCLTLFSSRSVVQESLQDRPKVSSRQRRAVGRRRRGDGAARRGLPACSLPPPTGAKPRKWRMRLKWRKWR